MIISISFDGVRFTTLESLSEYIVAMYGSWAGVPENHPDIAIVKALCGHNSTYYYVEGGVVHSK